jgi:hypothetical protein
MQQAQARSAAGRGLSARCYSVLLPLPLTILSPVALQPRTVAPGVRHAALIARAGACSADGLCSSGATKRAVARAGQRRKAGGVQHAALTAYAAGTRSGGSGHHHAR